MSQDPKKRNKDSKDVAEENIVEQSKDNEDPAAQQLERQGRGHTKQSREEEELEPLGAINNLFFLTGL
jgi:hypothetical protein